jgi:hypothetical protein
MAEAFGPPEMPPYPASLEELYEVFMPYYREKRPIDFFFELLILDVLDELPATTNAAVQQLIMETPGLFAGAGGDWKVGTRQKLHLSDTIDIAIQDLWIRNSKIALDQGWICHPWYFAKIFLQNYFPDDSQIDVWEGDALKEAKARIADWKKGH